MLLGSSGDGRVDERPYGLTRANFCVSVRAAASWLVASDEGEANVLKRWAAEHIEMARLPSAILRADPDGAGVRHHGHVERLAVKLRRTDLRTEDREQPMRLPPTWGTYRA